MTELTSSVTALNRDFACQNEAVIYRCVANSTTMDDIEFETTWRWNDDFVHTFISTQQIGVNNTCNSVRDFLHATLVYAAPTACVSLLIVLPSLPNYEDIRAPIECQAIADGTEPQNKTIYHNIISGESHKPHNYYYNNISNTTLLFYPTAWAYQREQLDCIEVITRI